MSNSFGAVETGQDASFEQQAYADEAAKVQAAKEALVEEQTGQPDELIMGKYGSQEELINAFKALQGEYSRLKGGASEPEAPAQNAAAEEPTPEPPQQNEQPQTEVPPEQAQQIISAVMQQAGGEQQYQAMAAWAAKNLSDDAVSAINDAMNSGDVGRALSAVKSMQYDYMQHAGYEPRLLGGRAPAAEGPKGFESEAQVVAAMADPRYQNGPSQDPAYVKEVEARLAASNVFSG